MGGNCTKSNPNDIASIKGNKDKKPITINLGSDPMTIGTSATKFTLDTVKSPKNVNTDPEFVAAKEA